MINFKSIIRQLLESTEDNTRGQRAGGLTGTSFDPRGHSKSSAIQGVGFYNRERENRYEYDPTNNPVGAEVAAGDSTYKLTQSQAQAATFQLEKKRYRQLSAIFGAISQNPETKAQAESIIHEYMDNFRAAQALKQRIGRNINSNLKTVLFKEPEPGTGSDNIHAPDLRPGESETRRIEIDKPSKHAKDIMGSERLMEWIESHDHIVFEEFVDFAVDVATPIILQTKIEAMKDDHNKARARAAANKQEFDDEFSVDESAEFTKVQEAVRRVLEQLYQTRHRTYQQSKEQYVRGGRGISYNLFTPVSAIAGWLNSSTHYLGRQQEKARQAIVTYNNANKVMGAISRIPEGKKVQRLLDIVDEVTHGLRKDTEATGRFYRPGVDKKEDERLAKVLFKNSEEFNDLKREADDIVSDLDVILGSGQFELYKLVHSFFNDEEGAEGALVRFILNDVVESFNN